MASLNGQTIASSYEQLLHVDRDGGGNANTLVSVKDGDNGTTFGIKLATNKVEIIPGSNDANAFEVSQADGTAVLTVDSTNALVGIGASASSYHSDFNNLVVYENGNAGISIIGSTSGESSLGFGDGTGADTYRGAVAYVHTSGDNQDKMFFKTSSLNRMIIDSSGNVAMGNTSASANLDVRGDSSKPIVNFGDENVRDSDATDIFGSGSFRYQFQNGQQARPAIIEGGGDTAVNEAAAYFTGFSSSQDDTHRNLGGMIVYRKGTSTSGKEGSQLQFRSKADNVATPAQNMVLDENGRLGIGTGSPSEKLQITETTHGSNVSMRFLAENDSGTLKEGNIRFDPDGENLLIVAGSGTDPDISVTASGRRVGIGIAAPTSKLHVYNAGVNEQPVRIQGSSSTETFDLGITGVASPAHYSVAFKSQEAANSGMAFYTRDSGGTVNERMVIQGNGAAGIGTAAPSALRLHVQAPDGLNSTASLVTIQNLETTDGQCQGLFVNAGQGSSDDSFRVQTRPGVEALRVKGDGAVTMATTLNVGTSITTPQLFIDSPGRLDKIANTTITDSNVTDIVQLNNIYTYIKVDDTAGGFGTICLGIGGNGVAFNWSLVDTDSNAWVGSGSGATITSTGASGNTYNITFNSGGGIMRIQRTSGSLNYDVKVYQIFE